jgi:hypothetical protein
VSAPYIIIIIITPVGGFTTIIHMADGTTIHCTGTIAKAQVQEKASLYNRALQYNINTVL